jgi:Tfp pilus assembly protein PilZ
VKPTERYVIEGVTCRLDGRGLPVANLSISGLFAASERPPLPGQVVKLALELGDRESYEVVGKVTWINDAAAKKAPNLPAGFGVRILQIGLPAKLAIVNALKRSPQRRVRP